MKNFFKFSVESRPRIAIVVKGIEAQLMPEFCSRDVLIIMMGLTKINFGEVGKVMVSLPYFFHEESGT